MFRLLLISCILLTSCVLLISCEQQNENIVSLDQKIELILTEKLADSKAKINYVDFSLSLLEAYKQEAFEIKIFQNIDHENENCKYLVKIVNSSKQDQIRYHDKCFEVCLISKDSIYIDGIIGSKSTLTLNYRANNAAQDYLDETDSRILNEFPNINNAQASYNCSIIGTDILNNIQENPLKIKLLLEYLRIVINEIEFERNAVSIKYFDQSFTFLSKKNKIIIAQLVPFSIHIRIDMEYCSQALMLNESVLPSAPL